MALGLVWGAATIALIFVLPDVPVWLQVVSLAYPVYYVVLSLALHLRRARTREGRMETGGLETKGQSSRPKAGGQRLKIRLRQAGG